MGGDRDLVSVVQLFNVIAQILEEKYGSGGKIEVVNNQCMDGTCRLVTNVAGCGICESGFSFDCEGWPNLKLNKEDFIECYVEDLMGCMLGAGILKEFQVPVMANELKTRMMMSLDELLLLEV